MAKEKPYQVGDEWWLNGRTLSCRDCKYFSKQEELETDYDYSKGFDYCKLHQFKFEGNHKTCESFSYRGYSSASSGLIEMLIGKLIFLAVSYFILTRLFELSGSGLLIVLGFVFMLSFIDWDS